MIETFLFILISPLILAGLIISVMFLAVVAFLPVITFFYPDWVDSFSSEFSDD